MRDAIVFPTWTWETFNVPERICLALAHLGAKVLYCQNPTSIFNRPSRQPKEVTEGVYVFQPVLGGQRLNVFRTLRYLQATLIRRQIAGAAKEMKLRDPLFIFFAIKGMYPLFEQAGRNWFMTYVCMDAAEPEADTCARISDATLVIPKSVFHQLQAKFGSKVHLIPQSVDFSLLSRAAQSGGPEPAALADIPRPRLGYLGPANGRLNNAVLLELFRSHPEWHFVSVGQQPILPLSNVHVVPWCPPGEFARNARALDVGFLPYNCHGDRELHCVPLKVFDYFALGIPVVSTPLINLWEYDDLIYFGNTADELAGAIQAALDEPPDSPKRLKRIEVARSHSIESLAKALRQVLPLDNGDGASRENAAPVETLDAMLARDVTVGGKRTR